MRRTLVKSHKHAPCLETNHTQTHTYAGTYAQNYDRHAKTYICNDLHTHTHIQRDAHAIIKIKQKSCTVKQFHNFFFFHTRVSILFPPLHFVALALFSLHIYTHTSVHTYTRNTITHNIYKTCCMPESTVNVNTLGHVFVLHFTKIICSPPALRHIPIHCTHPHADALGW